MPDALLATKVLNIRKTGPSLLSHIGRNAVNINVFTEMAGISEPVVGQVFVKTESESMNSVSPMVG